MLQKGYMAVNAHSDSDEAQKENRKATEKASDFLKNT